jgi:hypothetical protein
VIAVKRTRRISENLFQIWWHRGKEFRVWVFSSIFWGVGVFLRVWLADPYESGGLTYMSDDEVGHVFSMRIVPPLFLGALWFGYKRFVE